MNRGPGPRRAVMACGLLYAQTDPAPPPAKGEGETANIHVEQMIDPSDGRMLPERRKDVQMYERKTRYQMPRTVDEAAALLISDLRLDHQDALSAMTNEAFDQLYESVAPFIIDEFNLWTGNEVLLDNCLMQAAEALDQYDPARVILSRVREILCAAEGIVIVT